MPRSIALVSNKKNIWKPYLITNYSGGNIIIKILWNTKAMNMPWNDSPDAKPIIMKIIWIHEVWNTYENHIKIPIKFHSQHFIAKSSQIKCAPMCTECVRFIALSHI